MLFSSGTHRAITATALAVGLSLFAGGAQAAVCNISQLTTSTDCVDNVAGPGGNPTVAGMNAGNVFGINTWKQIDKFNAPLTQGATNPFLKITYVGNPNDSKSGTWSLVAGGSFDPTEMYAIGLKGGSSNAVYKLDTAFISGTWNTDGLEKGNGQPGPGLSNIRVFSTVPEIDAAAGMGSLAALGAMLAFARSRRRHAA